MSNPASSVRLVSIWLTFLCGTLPVHAVVPFTTVALSSQPALNSPAAGGGPVDDSAVFGNGFGPPSIDGIGHVAFVATVTGLNVTADVNDTGIWTDVPGSGNASGLHVVARADSTVPGGAGLRYGNFLAQI